MQPIIDMILELAREQIGFFDRGDPATFDFSHTDFIEDNTWRDLDLSPIVPEHAQAVLVRIKYRCDSAQKPIRFRMKGNVNLYNTSIAGTPAGAVLHWEDLIVSCDANRFIQYQIAAAANWNIEFTVAGWWLR